MREVNKNIESLNSQISELWDKNVSIRARDLEEGSDYSYIQIIKPWVIDEVLRHTKSDSHILDIGCGCGYLANAIYEQNRYNIKGMDLSLDSVSYATKRYPHINFIHQDIYSVSLEKKYDMCLGIMVLNNMPNINMFLKNVANVLVQNGKLILVIPHPCFWPVKHLNIKSFPYAKESSYLFKFSTKGRKDYSSQVIYFHRPLEQYINTIRKTGYKILCCKELREMDKDNLPDIMGIILQKF